MKPSVPGLGVNQGYQPNESVDQQFILEASSQQTSRPSMRTPHSELAALRPRPLQPQAISGLMPLNSIVPPQVSPYIPPYIPPGRHVLASDGTVTLYPHSFDASLHHVFGQFCPTTDYDGTAFALLPTISPADKASFGQRQFETAPLNTVRFVRRIVAPVGIPANPVVFPDPQKDPSEFMDRVLSMRHENSIEAEKTLHDLHTIMLDQFPETTESLRQRGTQSFQHFEQTDPDALKIIAAIDHYSARGSHALMNAIVCGHHSLPESLDATMPGVYRSDSEVKELVSQFLVQCKGGADYESQDVQNRFDALNELQMETHALDRFLQYGPYISDVCVVKTIAQVTANADDISRMQVNGRDYVRAFLMNQPIMYDSFLSTDFDPRKAETIETFSRNEFASRPQYVIDFTDTTGKSEVFRQDALADLNHAYEDQISEIVLIVRAKACRGKMIDSIPSRVRDGKKILLSSGHVLLPSMAVRCDQGYILFADAYHRDFIR